MLSYHFPLLPLPWCVLAADWSVVSACFPAVSMLAVFVITLVLSHTCGHLTLVFSGHQL